MQSTLHQQALQSLSPTDDGQKREELLKLVARYCDFVIVFLWCCEIYVVTFVAFQMLIQWLPRRKCLWDELNAWKLIGWLVG